LHYFFCLPHALIQSLPDAGWHYPNFACSHNVLALVRRGFPGVSTGFIKNSFFTFIDLHWPSFTFIGLYFGETVTLQEAGGRGEWSGEVVE
jgi:hypothetical protein